MTQRAFDRTTISCDHTFKISKYIGARRESDNKFVKQFENLFIVLNERHEVIGWRLTRTTSFATKKPRVFQYGERPGYRRRRLRFYCHCKPDEKNHREDR